RDAGDLWNLGNLLEKMVVLDLSSARFQDAAEHLREGLQTALRTGSRARVLDDLDCCGYLCALTGRRAEAVTLWAAVVVVQGHQGFSVPSHPDLPEGWFQRSLSDFLCKLGQSLSFCYITAGSFRRPGQTGTRSGNVTANAFMAAFQPRVPVPRCPLSRTSPSPSMWRPVTFLIPR